MLDAGSQLLAIIGRLVANPVKDKLKRNEIVIKLLKEFNFEPDHPPADFSGIYAYTLVEYGIGKPEPVLNLFKQTEIKEAFRQAFDRNNFNILLQEGDRFLDWNILGDELKELEIEPRKEFATFASVFLKVIERSRTPAEVISDRKVESLQRQISELSNLFGRLTLSEARIELALQTKNYPLLDSAGKIEQQKVDNFILAEQMRAWFETLGYEFDPYQNEIERYFEWILLEETRRGHDRILVRGVEGEIGVGNINSLRQTVEVQNCDEGWLVTSRRIAPAAKDALSDREYKNLYCYTFDELIDEKVDFSNYFEWLETEVKSKQIDSTYVALGCTKEEIDLISQATISKSAYGEDEGWIDGYIERWLCDRSKEHISVLGEFGTGKTWFTLHFAWTELQKYLDAKKRGVERPRLPIVIPLRDYAKALDVGNVIAGFFFSKHNIRLTRAVFDRLNRMGKLLLIFDGFDEMADKVDRQKMINNFWELARVVTPGSKAILTCRTEHFPEAKQGRSLLNAELQASTAALTGEPPQFEVLELKKFSEAQIREVLSFKTASATVDKIMANSQLLDLASRPVMIDLIIEALPEIEAGKPIDISRVYLYAVRRKMERDIKSERTFTSLADKLYFMCELSWEMLSTDTMSLNYKLFPDRIRNLFGSVVQNETDLDHWHYDMMGQTMLIRNADGDYTPAHRSLLEFFVAYKFAAELGILADDFLDIARQQANIDWSLPPQDYTWSEYFNRECDEQGKIKPIAPLKEFSSEDTNLLVKNFGKESINNSRLYFEHKTNTYSAVFGIIQSMLKNESDSVLYRILKSTRVLSLEQAGILGGNISTLLIHTHNSFFRQKNISNSKLRKADLSNADLSNADLSNSILVDTVFDSQSLCINTCFRKCNLSNVSLRYITLGYISSIPFFSGNIDSQDRQNMKLKYGIDSAVCGRVDFAYSHDPGHNSWAEKIISKPQLGEITVFYTTLDKDIKWEIKIKSIYVLRYEINQNILHLITIEGQFIEIDIETGKFITPLINESYLQSWNGADLEGATGLNAKVAYILRLLGAINVPKISYEYNPYEDPEVIPGLINE